MEDKQAPIGKFDNINKSNYRKRAIEAKGRYCQICGSEDDIVVHHVDGDKENASLKNLLPVCKKCHKSIHHGRVGYEKWYQKLPESSRQDELPREYKDVIPVFDKPLGNNGTIHIPKDIRMAHDIEQGDRIIIDIEPA